MTRKTPHTLISHNVTPEETYIHDKKDQQTGQKRPTNMTKETPHTLILYNVTPRWTYKRTKETNNMTKETNKHDKRDTPQIDLVQRDA